MKIPKRLQPLVDDGLIEGVVRPLMSGKEASVLVVLSGGEVRCAKVYKEATNRSFRQRADYQEGRGVRNSRRARAMAKRSKFGKSELEEAWQNTEVDTIYKLSSAGVRVPKPHMFSDGVLIMELVVDADGNAAPRLNDIQLSAERARRYHAFLLNQVVRMLCAGLIHGDLSEYNVLVGPDGPVIIDFPQAVNAAGNQNAQRMLLRDVDNMRAYFARFAGELKKTRYGKEIWKLYERGELHPEVELTGVVEDETRLANVDGVLRDIEDAREEHHRRFGRKVVDIEHEEPEEPADPPEAERSRNRGKPKSSQAQGAGRPEGDKKRRRPRQSGDGARQNAAGARQNTAGARQNAAANRQNAAGARQNTAANRQDTAANRQDTAANRQDAAAAPQNSSSRERPQPPRHPEGGASAEPQKRRRRRRSGAPSAGQDVRAPKAQTAQATPSEGAPPKRRRRRRRKLSDSEPQVNSSS
jgi:RIO kinase 1